MNSLQWTGHYLRSQWTYFSFWEQFFPQTKINQCTFREHMLLDLDKLKRPSSINKLRMWGFITVWILSAYLSMQMTKGCKCMASSSRVLQIDCLEVIARCTANICTGRCPSINSTIIKLNILNVHIYYVREDLFDLAVDLQLQKEGVHILPDKWHFNFQVNIQNCSSHLPFKSAAPIINQ